MNQKLILYLKQNRLTLIILLNIYIIESIDLNNNICYINKQDKHEEKKDVKKIEVPYITVSMPKTFASHVFCFICKTKSGISYSIYQLQLCCLFECLLKGSTPFSCESLKAIVHLYI